MSIFILPNNTANFNMVTSVQKFSAIYYNLNILNCLTFWCSLCWRHWWQNQKYLRILYQIYNIYRFIINHGFMWLKLLDSKILNFMSDGILELYICIMFCVKSSHYNFIFIMPKYKSRNGLCMVEWLPWVKTTIVERFLFAFMAIWYSVETNCPTYPQQKHKSWNCVLYIQFAKMKSYLFLFSSSRAV